MVQHALSSSCYVSKRLLFLPPILIRVTLYESPAPQTCQLQAPDVKDAEHQCNGAFSVMTLNRDTPRSLAPSETGQDYVHITSSNEVSGESYGQPQGGGAAASGSGPHSGLYTLSRQSSVESDFDFVDIVDAEECAHVEVSPAMALHMEAMSRDAQCLNPAYGLCIDPKDSFNRMLLQGLCQVSVVCYALLLYLHVYVCCLCV